MASVISITNKDALPASPEDSTPDARDDRWPPHKTFVFVVAASALLWAAILIPILLLV